jgi:hypothetical protein
LIILIILGEEYKSRSSSLRNFLHYPVTSSFFGPNILLSTLFSNTLSLCSRDQVSHPYRTIGKIMVLYILIFKFFGSRWEDRRFWTEWQQALPEFNLTLISSWIKFWFVTVSVNTAQNLCYASFIMHIYTLYRIKLDS